MMLKGATGQIPSATIMVEEPTLTIEKVGLGNLTSADVRKAMINIKDSDLGFGVPARMSNGYPVYWPFIIVHQFKGGQNVPVTDFIPACIVVGGPGSPF